MDFQMELVSNLKNVGFFNINDFNFFQNDGDYMIVVKMNQELNKMVCQFSLNNLQK